MTRDQALQESMKKSDRISELEQEIEGLSGSLLECQQQICENESHRRKLHNTIQELKGASYAHVCLQHTYTCTCM